MNRKNYRITITAKILIVELFICSAGLLLGFIWRVYSEDKKWSNLIYPGIKVSRINLEGKTLNEGRELLKLKYINPLLNKKTNILADGKTYVLDNSKLISDYNTNVIINQAFHFGKNLSPLKKIMLLRKGFPKQYNIAFTFNENYIEDSIKAIRSDIDKEPLNASVNCNNDDIITINADSNGLKLNEVELEEDIKKKISSPNSSTINIDAPVEKTSAEITASKLSSVNAKIASYSTSFSSSFFARDHNMELATESINGKLIMPGEIFSFNQCVGERTADRGFMEAPVIVGDDVESGIGGGICQVSSTLYNAILQTGISSLERTNHSLPSSYVPLGLDATVDWNDIDYKFKNTLDYPIYIEAYIENENLYVNIYSNSSLTTKKYTITSNIYDIIQSDTKVIDTPNLQPGETSVIQKGSAGYKVRVQRYAYENGLLINSETISDDLYLPVPNVIDRGSMNTK